MARSRLAPLTRLREQQREPMAETLLAWLETGLNAKKAAVRLRVHPQTVRYRIRRMEELFGPCLRDPARRFELGFVLSARRLLGPVEGLGRSHSLSVRARMSSEGSSCFINVSMCGDVRLAVSYCS